MTTVTVKSTKPPIKLVSERSGITLVIDRSITTTSGGGSGTVTNVSASAPLSVTSPTTTPAITISAATTLLPGTLSAADKIKLDSVTSGAAVSAVSGSLPVLITGTTAAPTVTVNAATTLLPGTLSAADKIKLDSVTSGAAVSAVSGTAPIVVTGTTTPAVSISAATTSAAGTLSASDKTKLDGVGAGATVTTVTGTAPIVSSGGAAPAISVTTGFAALTVAAGNDARIVALPILVSGQYTASTPNATTNQVLNLNRCYYTPFMVSISTTFDRIAIDHTSVVGGAGSVARLGIYSATAGLPASLVLDAGTIDLTTAAAFKAITISQTLTPGLYFLAATAQYTSGLPQFRTAPPQFSVPDAANISTGTKFEAVSGVLPATATPGTSNATAPYVIYLRKA